MRTCKGPTGLDGAGGWGGAATGTSQHGDEATRPGRWRAHR